MTTRSHRLTVPLTATPSTRPRRPRTSMFGGCPVRRSTTPATVTPARSRSEAAASPRSSAAMTNARSPGFSDQRLTRRRTPSASITPTRSLPGKTSGCSIEPAATTTRPALILTRVDPYATGTKPYSKRPIADAGESSSTPAARARARSSAARPCPSGSASSVPPTAGPSSTTITRAPSAAASVAASRPDLPPPITTTSACSWTTSTRSRRDPFGSSFPSPATPRSTFS